MIFISPVTQNEMQWSALFDLKIGKFSSISYQRFFFRFILCPNEKKKKERGKISQNHTFILCIQRKNYQLQYQYSKRVRTSRQCVCISLDIRRILLVWCRSVFNYFIYFFFSFYFVQHVKCIRNASWRMHWNFYLSILIKFWI